MEGNSGGEELAVHRVTKAHAREKSAQGEESGSGAQGKHVDERGAQEMGPLSARTDALVCGHHPANLGAEKLNAPTPNSCAH